MRTYRVMSGPFPGQQEGFLSKRHYIPLSVPFPVMLGFSTCKIAPGLEIRECGDTDNTLLDRVGKEWSKAITVMHTVPIQNASHIICVDEQIYGEHIEQKIRVELQRPTKPTSHQLNIEYIFKMILIALNLLRLFPIYPVSYFISQDIDSGACHPTFFRRVKVVWEAWSRYASAATNPTTYDLTGDGTITCSELQNTVSLLEKYYRHDGWIANRVAVALYNFWNALFLDECTLSFVALMSILETFSNLSGDPSDPVLDQIRRNVPKLIPLDAHGKAVTVERLNKIYDTRSIIAHGSFGHDRHGTLTWHVTNIDAKWSNVDIRLSSDLMSMAAKMLHRVIFDPNLLSIIENSKTRNGERKAIRRYVDSLTDAKPVL